MNRRKCLHNLYGFEVGKSWKIQCLKYKTNFCQMYLKNRLNFICYVSQHVRNCSVGNWWLQVSHAYALWSKYILVEILFFWKKNKTCSFCTRVFCGCYRVKIWRFYAKIGQIFHRVRTKRWVQNVTLFLSAELGAEKSFSSLEIYGSEREVHKILIAEKRKTHVP